MPTMQVSPVATAIASLGGAREVARRRNLKAPWSVYKWINKGLPSEHVLWLAEQTGWKWTPHQLVPELYPHPDDGLPVHLRARTPLEAA
jgi:hypothetical protein